MSSVGVSCNILVDTLYSNLKSSAAIGEHLTGRWEGGGRRKVREGGERRKVREGGERRKVRERGDRRKVREGGERYLHGRKEKK